MAEEATSTKVRMRVQDHNARAVYANAFRHNSTPNEVILDLGINTLAGRPSSAKSENEALTAEMLFQVDTRLVLNYDTVRRLAMLLGQVVQQHDSQIPSRTSSTEQQTFQETIDPADKPIETAS